ncbi:hypothetical protein [Saccharopolyspora spinosa]|uniref:Outer membrane channel protein CpnT-like N-terminal domain-containing protein n=1 Tax=Saccharopolyspora spinosa TaxID=60894 RepID=A0A2N3XXB2_SACSN|nr:hypothetical protein [Saccharopolyspora spinosa]PKW15271.1 hypothetical protein A8926_2964 [Saccharopolyspora spinosa]
MGIEIPDAVKWLTPIVVGASWPEGDETALRRVAEAWTTAGQDVDDVIAQTEAAVQASLGTMQGQTHDAFEQFVKDFVNGDAGYLPELKKLCESLGEGADGAALEIEYTKMSIIAALIILAAQIAAMIASAVATFGASTAGIPIAQAATQITVRTIFMNLLKQIAINLAINLGVDGAIQGIQFAKGDRKSWDLSNTLEAGISGIAAGVAGGLVDGAAGALGNKLGKNLVEPATRSFTEAAAYGAGKGALSGMLGNTINKALHREMPGWGDLTSGAISGGVAGATGGMQSRHEGLNATWEGNGRGNGWVSGENNQGWRFESSEGALHGANVDSPYNRGFNSTHGQHIPGDGGPNNVNNNPYDDGRPSYSDGSAQLPSTPEKLDLPDGPNK